MSTTDRMDENSRIAKLLGWRIAEIMSGERYWTVDSTAYFRQLPDFFTEHCWLVLDWAQKNWRDAGDGVERVKWGRFVEKLWEVRMNRSGKFEPYGEEHPSDYATAMQAVMNEE